MTTSAAMNGQNQRYEKDLDPCQKLRVQCVFLHANFHTVVTRLSRLLATIREWNAFERKHVCAGTLPVPGTVQYSAQCSLRT
jgi:hypothetical protein